MCRSHQEYALLCEMCVCILGTEEDRTAVKGRRGRSERGGRGDETRGLGPFWKSRRWCLADCPNSNPYLSSQPLPQTGQLRPVNWRASFGQVEGDFVLRYQNVTGTLVSLLSYRKV